MTRWLKFHGLGRRLVILGLGVALALGLTLSFTVPARSNSLSNASRSSASSFDSSYFPIPALSPGYWKTHREATTALLPQDLGNYTVTTFTEAHDVLEELDCGDVGALECMAGMLIAAELNVAHGSSMCIVTNGTINSATNLLTASSYSGPDTYALSAVDQTLAISLHGELSAYNSDRVPNCWDSP